MKILVTGAKGFIGKNLIEHLKNHGYHDIYEYDVDTNLSLLKDFCNDAEFVYHLAGINRPTDQREFMEGNFEFTSLLLGTLSSLNNKCPVMLSSSIQAELNNPYGESKKAGEELLLDYGRKTGAQVLVYRFPNVFGKWSRPNYNSAIATFCYNIARGLPITVNDPQTVVNLVYIDDVVEELIRALSGNENREGDYCTVSPVYKKNLGEITDLINGFKQSRNNLYIPDMGDAFTLKLYSTYLTYLPEQDFSYTLKMHENDRGSFTEFLKSSNRGQVSVNIIKPGTVKGNHWHHTKNEKFLVVCGIGVIRFRRIDGSEVIEYHVRGEKMEVVDIPPGYTHNIENLGNEDMVVLVWANEIYNPEKQDTYQMEV